MIENQGVDFIIDLNFASISELAADDLVGKFIQYKFLHQTFQRARAELGVESLLGQILPRRRFDRDLDLMLEEALRDEMELDVDDALDVPPAERFEDDDLVDAVQEFGPEALAERPRDLAAVPFLLFLERPLCWSWGLLQERFQLLSGHACLLEYA